MTELKNCPFCGMEPVVSEHVPKVHGIMQWMITCENSHCNFNPSAHGFSSSDYAIKAWNTRADKKMENPCVYDNGDGVKRCSITKNPVGTDTVNTN